MIRLRGCGRKRKSNGDAFRGARQRERARARVILGGFFVFFRKRHVEKMKAALVFLRRPPMACVLWLRGRRDAHSSWLCQQGRHHRRWSATRKKYAHAAAARSGGEQERKSCVGGSERAFREAGRGRNKQQRNPAADGNRHNCVTQCRCARCGCCVSGCREFSTPRRPPRPRRRRTRRQPPRSPSRGRRDPRGPRRTHPPPYPHRRTSGRRRAWST